VPHQTSVGTRRLTRDPQFEIAANSAYYGGHFEVSRLGFLRGPIYEYDKNSAYPAEMRNLPCPLHTQWEHKPRAGRLPEGKICVAEVCFTHPPDGLWCGLPFRGKNGDLYWPRQGTGWYWSAEIEAACRCLHARVAVQDLWVARRKCNCRLFDWIEELYELRRRLGPDTRGQPLKFGLNSLYGKLAQRSGRGPYHDPVSAGLITAATRTRLIEALAHDPEAVFMLATDAVYSTRPLPLDIGEGLGQWEAKLWPDLFVVQPGVYWSPSELEKSLKSRGAPRSVIGDAAPRFVAAWDKLHERLCPAEFRERRLEERLFPPVPVAVRVFYGCRLAMHLNKPWLAGKWEDKERQESFEWKTKRDPNRIDVYDEGYIVTYPREQSMFAVSEGKPPADFEKRINIGRKRRTRRDR
jgi:DNA polymerase type B, organellar and viral